MASYQHILDATSILSQIATTLEKRQPKFDEKLTVAKGDVHSESFGDYKVSIHSNLRLARSEYDLLTDLNTGLPTEVAEVLQTKMGPNKLTRLKKYAPSTLLNTFEIELQNALDAYENRNFNSVLVLRSSYWTEISYEGLVPGDIIILDGIKEVPCDCRLLYCSENASVDISSLHAEMGIRNLTAEDCKTTNVLLANNLALKGSIWIEGWGIGFCYRIGDGTFQAHMLENMEMLTIHEEKIMENMLDIKYLFGHNMLSKTMKNTLPLLQGEDRDQFSLGVVINLDFMKQELGRYKAIYEFYFKLLSNTSIGNEDGLNLPKTIAQFLAPTMKNDLQNISDLIELSLITEDEETIKLLHNFGLSSYHVSKFTDENENKQHYIIAGGFDRKELIDYNFCFSRLFYGDNLYCFRQADIICHGQQPRFHQIRILFDPTFREETNTISDVAEYIKEYVKSTSNAVYGTVAKKGNEALEMLFGENLEILRLMGTEVYENMKPTVSEAYENMKPKVFAAHDLLKEKLNQVGFEKIKAKAKAMVEKSSIDDDENFDFDHSDTPVSL